MLPPRSVCLNKLSRTKNGCLSRKRRGKMKLTEKSKRYNIKSFPTVIHWKCFHKQLQLNTIYCSISFTAGNSKTKGAMWRPPAYSLSLNNSKIKCLRPIKYNSNDKIMKLHSSRNQTIFLHETHSTQVWKQRMPFYWKAVFHQRRGGQAGGRSGGLLSRRGRWSFYSGLVEMRGVTNSDLHFKWILTVVLKQIV